MQLAYVDQSRETLDASPKVLVAANGDPPDLSGRRPYPHLGMHADPPHNGTDEDEPWLTTLREKLAGPGQAVSGGRAYQLIVFAAGQCHLERLVAVQCACFRADGHLVDADLRVDTAPLADVLEVGDEAIADINRTAHAGLHQREAGAHPRNRSPMRFDQCST